VICIEDVGLRAGGLAVQLDEEHLVSLASFVMEAMEPHLQRLKRAVPATSEALGGRFTHLPDARLLVRSVRASVFCFPRLSERLLERPP
jgi:hypothetical protein